MQVGGRRLLAGFWGGCTVCPGKSIGVTSELLQGGVCIVQTKWSPKLLNGSDHLPHGHIIGETLNQKRREEGGGEEEKIM